MDTLTDAFNALIGAIQRRLDAERVWDEKAAGDKGF
jgi:hypothetical protein